MKIKFKNVIELIEIYIVVKLTKNKISHNHI